MAPEPSQCALLSAVCEPRLQHQAPRGPRSHPRRVPMRLCRRSWGSFGKGTVVPEGHPQAPTLALGQGGIGLQGTSESRQELAQGAGPAEEAAGGPHLGSRPRPAVGRSCARLGRRSLSGPRFLRSEEAQEGAEGGCCFLSLLLPPLRALRLSVRVPRTPWGLFLPKANLSHSLCPARQPEPCCPVRGGRPDLPRGPPAASGGTGYRCQGPCPPGRGRRLPPPHTCRLLETPRPL